MKTSQKESIRKHMMAGKSITALDALNMFGCFRLAARIADLRNDGWKIATDIVQIDNKKFARYRLT